MNATQNQAKHRRNAWLMVLCALLAVGLLAWLGARFLLAQQPEAARLEKNDAGSAVRIESDNVRMLFEDGCFEVRWRAQAIQTITLNGAATVGEARQTICGGDALFEIRFQDGLSGEYLLARNVLIGRGLIWQLPLAAFVFGLASLYYAGLFPRVDFGRVLLVRAPRSERQKMPVPLWSMVLLILLGAALRVPFLDIPIRGDEAWSFLDYASQPLSQAISRYDSTNNHLLHTLLQYIAFHVFGNHEIWLRLPVFFAGLLGIAAAYRAGTELFNRRVGVLLAVLIAANSRMVEFSVNARAYSLWVLFLLLMLVCGHRALRGNRRRDWALLAVLVALSLYLTPLTLYSLGMVGLWLLLNLLALYRGEARRRRLVSALTATALAAFITLVLYLPVLMWLLNGVSESSVGATVAPATPLSEYAWLFPGRVMTTWGDLTQDIGVGLRGALALGFIVACLVYRRLAREPLSLPLAALLWLLPLHYLTRSIVVWRAYLFLIPILAMVAFAGWDVLLNAIRWSPRGRRLVSWAIPAVLALALAVGVYTARWPVESYDSVPGAQAAADYLENHFGEYDLVDARHPVDNALRYYLSRRNTTAARAAMGTLEWQPSDGRPERILFVVNFIHGNISSQKDDLPFDMDRYHEPRFIGALPHGELWLMSERD